MPSELSSFPGCCLEKWNYNGSHILVIDIGGNAKLRPIWRELYPATDGLIFVVDSCDKERIEVQSNQELKELLTLFEEFNDVPLLVMANKQENHLALPLEDITNKLELNKLKMKWFIQGTSALTTQGLKEGLDWIVNAALEKK